MTMEQGDPTAPRGLFVVRFWAEEQGTQPPEWRGRVQHLPDGEARYFRDWATLIAFLQQALSPPPLAPAPPAAPCPPPEPDPA